MKHLLTSLLLACLFISTAHGALPTVELVGSLPPSLRYPFASLTWDGAGHFYGLSPNGGANNNGAVFKVDRDGNITPVLSFANQAAPKGNVVQRDLTLGSDGNFYGVTQQGGDLGRGTLFKMTPAGGLETLVNFTGLTGSYLGAYPNSAPLFDGQGNLYGVTRDGGINDLGTLYKRTPDGTFTTLHHFGSTASSPVGNLVWDAQGNLYGYTSAGNGTVFKWSAEGQFSIVVEFTGLSGAKKGGKPNGRLLLGPDGNFYGTSQLGGSDMRGTIFKLTPTGDFTTLVEFINSNGAFPVSGLTLGQDGHFYGMTNAGGTPNYGTVFQMTAAGELTTLLSFTQSGNGAASAASPVYGHFTPDDQGNLYAAVYSGGANDSGAIIRISPARPATPTVDLVSEIPYTSRLPGGGLIYEPDGNFYGLSSKGGDDYGSLFRMTPAGAFTNLFNFTGTAGAYKGNIPYGTLVRGSDGSLYGMTEQGGPSRYGNIFKWSQVNGFTNLVDFTGNDTTNKGAWPQGGLTLGQDGDFYGVTLDGGTGGIGTIFKMTPQGVLTTLVNLQNNGSPSLPIGDLIQAPNGDFYGTSLGGGANGEGTVFKMTPQGQLQILVSFTGNGAHNKGANPEGSLIFGADGFLYGMTSTGGLMITVPFSEWIFRGL